MQAELENLVNMVEVWELLDEEYGKAGEVCYESLEELREFKLSSSSKAKGVVSEE